MIKKVLLLVFFSCVSCYSFSQRITDSLLCSFLNQTLCSFFEDSIIIHEQGEFKDVLIEIDFNINCLLKETKYLKFKYVSLDKENEYKKHIKTLKNRQYRMIYFLKYTFLSIDTIDITISSSNIYKGGEKGYEIAVSCRGTIGYIPQGRFIYDKKRDEWDFILGKTILNEKAEEIDEYYKKIHCCPIKN